MMGEARQGLKFSGEGQPLSGEFHQRRLGGAGRGPDRLGKARHDFFN